MGVILKIIGILKSLFGISPGTTAGTAQVNGPFVINSTAANAPNFTIKDTGGSSVFVFNLNGNELTVGGVTINGALGIFTTVAASDFRANSFDAFTITNPTLRWPSSTADVSVYRLAAGVAAVGTGGTSGAGWFQVTGGRSRLTSTHTNATATPTNVTGLTHTLVAGRKYTGRLVVICSNTVAADGFRLDFDGGTATMTAFAAGLVGNPQGATFSVLLSAALATDIIATALASTATHYLVFEITMEVANAGTFIPRIGLEAASTGTLTTAVGTYLFLEDTP